MSQPFKVALYPFAIYPVEEKLSGNSFGTLRKVYKNFNNVGNIYCLRREVTICRRTNRVTGESVRLPRVFEISSSTLIQNSMKSGRVVALDVSQTVCQSCMLKPRISLFKGNSLSLFVAIILVQIEISIVANQFLINCEKVAQTNSLVFHSKNCLLQ